MTLPATGLHGPPSLDPAIQAPNPGGSVAGAFIGTRCPRRCRVCGCIDACCLQCVKQTGDSCAWIELDLCSACAGRVLEAARGAVLCKLGTHLHSLHAYRAGVGLCELLGVVERMGDGTWAYRAWDRVTDCYDDHVVCQWREPDEAARALLAWHDLRADHIERLEELALPTRKRRR